MTTRPGSLHRRITAPHPILTEVQMYRLVLLIAVICITGCVSSRNRIPEDYAEASNSGFTSDPKWAPYTEYIKTMEKAIVHEWYRINAESRTVIPSGARVVVTWKINSKGITEILKVEDAGAGKQAVMAATNAIQNCQPFRKWSDEMIAGLGTEQTLVFGFSYR